MTLTEQEIQNLKNQLSEQIKDLPAQQKQAAQEQIDSMSPEALEQLLKEQQSKSPYRLIIAGQIESALIEETSEAKAVLEIMPKSEGHTIIIPKNQISSNTLPKEIQEFSKKVANKLQERLQPKKVDVIPTQKFGETIIELIPDYGKPLNENPERVEMGQLQETLKKINTEVIKVKKEEPKEEDNKKESPKEEKKEKILKLPRRIP